MKKFKINSHYQKGVKEKTRKGAKKNTTRKGGDFFKWFNEPFSGFILAP